MDTSRRADHSTDVRGEGGDLMSTTHFFVPGLPRPKGNHRIGRGRGSGDGYIYDSTKGLKAWQDAIAQTAIFYVQGRRPRIPRNLRASVELVFYFEREGGDELADMVRKPDLDKLVRAVLDALTGIAYEDDSQVASIKASKLWSSPTGRVGGDSGVAVTVTG
jgi:crossover junction endodeoxyribonuclease RusA